MQDTNKFIADLNNLISLKINNINDLTDINDLSKFILDNFIKLIKTFIINKLKEEYHSVKLTSDEGRVFYIKMHLFDSNYRVYCMTIANDTIFNVVGATQNKDVDNLFNNKMINSIEYTNFIYTTYLVPDEGKFISYKPLIKMIKEDIEKTKQYIKNFDLKI
jgi:hypothetical protein